MAIKLIYGTIVIKKQEVILRFPGGWEEWLKFNKNDKLGPSWSDEYLFARGSMDPACIENITMKWQRAGFNGIAEDSGMKRWVDFCDPDSSIECHWLSYLEEPAAVFLAGTEAGDVRYPE